MASSSTRTRTRRSSRSLSGNNVILATPTGSGKSLVALGAHRAALADDRVSFYTAPIKALVSEKFFDLCAVLGADQVGMLTGDASVNPEAPVICCTAEVLANIALREGSTADVGLVVMDEFHFYAEPDRGWAWQVPLLELPQAQFVLMSATLGDVSDLAADLTPPQRPRDLGDRRRGAAGAADVQLGPHPARRDAGGAGRAPTRLPSTSSTSPRPRRSSTRPACSTPAVSPQGASCSTSGWPGSGSARGSARRSRSCCGAASACITPGCCRATGGSWSSSPRPGC